MCFTILLLPLVLQITFDLVFLQTILQGFSVVCNRVFGVSKVFGAYGRL